MSGNIIGIKKIRKRYQLDQAELYKTFFGVIIDIIRMLVKSFFNIKECLWYLKVFL